MLKLLHVADIHLNHIYGRYPKPISEKLRNHHENAFQNSISYALAQEVDAFIIAGDLLDQEYPDFQIERLIINGIRQLLKNEIHVFYTPGNHDFLGVASWGRDLTKSSFFHYAQNPIPESYEFQTKTGVKVHLTACGHNQKNIQTNVISQFPEKSDGNIWIGVAHASVDAHKLHDPYMPAALKDIQALNYDYFALGHIHKREKLSSKIAYSGSIQGLHALETGLKGGYLVTVDAYQTHIEPINFSEVVWENLTLNVASCKDSEALIRLIVTSLKSMHQSSKFNHMVRIHLQGRSKIYNLMQGDVLDQISAEIMREFDCLYLEIKGEGLEPELDVETYKKEKTVLSDLLDQLDKWQDIPELKEKLLNLPIFPTHFDNTQKVEFVDAKLFQIQNEVLNRMVK